MYVKLLFTFILILLMTGSRVWSQTDTIQQRVFLVGDAGELHNGRHPVIDWLKEKVNWNDTSNSVLFLGDNIYDMGLPLPGAPGYDAAKNVLDYQISLVRGKKSRAWFIPGNHDWMNGKIGGYQQAVNQTNYINGLSIPNVKAFPLDGCPGPVLVELDNKVILVFGDSQWFLHLHDKPGPGSACAASTIDEFVTELNEIIATHPNQLMIFAVHHPFYTYGSHGGDYTWKNHIFPFTAINPNLYIPLPIIGSAYPIARGFFGNIQDIYHPLYRNMINEIENTLKKHPNPIHVAGHEHGLQFNMKDSIPYIVSGSGSKLTSLRKGKYSLFSHVDYGFALIEVYTSGKVQAKYYDVHSKDLKTPIYTHDLRSIVEVVPPSTQDTQSYKIPDYVTIVPDARLKASSFKSMLVGKNYRDDWTAQVKVPVLDLGKEAGGLRTIRQSGGAQLRVLTLEDKKGKLWELRSIERFPQNIIPPDLRTPMTPNYFEDAISAAYPYAPLIVTALNEAAGIPAVRQKILYVPDDPRLTRFTNNFKNSLAILAEREPRGVPKTITTNELALTLQEEPANRVDQRRVLRARLMDNFVMNFNRNQNQWQWTTADTGFGKVYYPIPEHSNQAFFLNQGFIPKLAHRILAIPEIQGFDDKADDITAFNRTAYSFDHQFLNKLTQEDWRAETDTFLARMEDSAIIRAVESIPTPVTSSKSFIIRMLQKRKSVFKEEMLAYYNHLSKEVTIAGTKQRELFRIETLPEGLIHVQGFSTDSSGRKRVSIYDRVFDPSITKEIRIYGLEGEDTFSVRGPGSPIQLRLVGGPGSDYFTGGTGRNTKIYDATFENNYIESGSAVNLKLSDDPHVNNYNRNEITRDYTSPGVSIAYNVDEGALPGAEIEVFRSRFRKDPYSSRHLLEVKYATATNSSYFTYESDFNKVIRDLNVAVRAELRAPNNVTNFFGLGNNTVFDKTKPGGIEYYRLNYDIGNFFVVLRRNLQSWLNAGVGPALQYYRLEQLENNDKLLYDMGKPGFTDYKARYALGLEGRVNVNSKNNQVLPTRGAFLRLYGRQLVGLNRQSNNLTQVGLDLSFFMSINPNTKTVLGTRFGFGHNIGDFDIPQAQYLGGTENLRGYRKDRFAGRTVFFNNTELRVRLRQFRTYLFPGSYGFLLYHDIGRVWSDNERSVRWHNGYGGGLWISPVHRFVLTGTLSYSPDEELLPAIGFGYQF